MIVSKFKSDKDLEDFGLQVVDLLGLVQNEDGRFDTTSGEKTAKGLARYIERLYRERVYGREELPADEKYYAANISGEDPQWPTKPVDSFPN
jgi:hypothetical protein